MKKKLFSILLALCIAALTSCGNAEFEESSTSASLSQITKIQYEDNFCFTELESDYENKIEIYQYEYSGWGTSHKTITGYAAQELANALSALAPDSDTSPKISDDVFSKDALSWTELPAERGTAWLEFDGKIYRFSPYLDSVCIVKTHYGEGYMLDAGKDFFNLFRSVLYYHPNNYYTGNYKNGNLTVSHVYYAESEVDIKIADMEVNKEITEYNTSKNTVTLELTSEKDMSAQVSLISQQSDDNLTEGADKTLELTANVSSRLTLTFYGWTNWSYYITIKADNTVVRVFIDPTE